MKKRSIDRIGLDAIRVFEAAARHLNFSAAGRELGVTQAAVSRRIQKLEADLAVALFTRRGRAVALTEGGDRLYRRAQASLDYLCEGLDEIGRAHRDAIVSLSASNSVSHFWLSHQLRAYAFEHPGASVRLLTSDAMADLASEANDLAILYSTGEHPTWRLTRLFAEELTPVAAPAYLDRADPGWAPGALTLAQVAALDLFDYDRFNPYWVTLRDWFTRLGGGAARPRVVYSNYPLTIEAALRGDGVALGSRHMLTHYLSAGALAEPCAETLTTGYGYYLGLPRAAPSSEAALQLYAWLLSRAGAGSQFEQAALGPRGAPV